MGREGWRVANAPGETCTADPAGQHRSLGTPPWATWRWGNLARRAFRRAARLPHGRAPPRGPRTLSATAPSPCRAMGLLPSVVTYRPLQRGARGDQGAMRQLTRGGEGAAPSLRCRAGLLESSRPWRWGLEREPPASGAPRSQHQGTDRPPVTSSWVGATPAGAYGPEGCGGDMPTAHWSQKTRAPSSMAPGQIGWRGKCRPV